MLVLTRKLDQSISVGGLKAGEIAIEVKVIEIRGDQVRLGIVAPQDVEVHRKEVWLDIQKNGPKPA